MNLRVALDWTPNPIHAGIFLARAKGWFRELGIDVQLIGVEDDSYQRSTVEKLLHGETDIAIMPGEMMLNEIANGNKLVAIATLLQGNSSFFATKPDIKPGQSIRYGALGLPYEQELIQQLWPNAEMLNPPRLEVYKQLFENHVDLVWLYKPIEGVEAEQNGIHLKYYSLEEASIPYGHAPLLVTTSQFLQEKPKETKRFLEVCSRGYLYTAINLQETIEILIGLNIPGIRERQLLKNQLLALKPYWLNENEQWGNMNHDRWQHFFAWLKKHTSLQLTENELSESYTNDFLKYSVIKA
jgi:NitT/TauT family transport system substrate-binding protein